MDTINIAIALNKNVLYPAYVMLRSLAKNHSLCNVCVYVLHSELSTENCNFLKDALMRGMENNEIHFIFIDPQMTSQLPYNRFWSSEMYYRLMLPELLGDRIDRILYLDVDIIVNKNITEFYNTNFENYLMVVAKDMEFEKTMMLDMPEEQSRQEFFRELTKQGMTYFCSGVLLMNLPKLKEKYSFELYKEIFFQISSKVRLPDQDLLNYVHYKQVKFADEKKYGLFTQTVHEMGMTYQEVSENVSILHFTGQAKPWTINLIRYDIEKIWWEYAKDTPFYWQLLESVFLRSMESHFAEDKFHELVQEKEQLQQLLNKCQEVFSAMR